MIPGKLLQQSHLWLCTFHPQTLCEGKWFRCAVRKWLNCKVGIMRVIMKNMMLTYLYMHLSLYLIPNSCRSPTEFCELSAFESFQNLAIYSSAASRLQKHMYLPLRLAKDSNNSWTNIIKPTIYRSGSQKQFTNKQQHVCCRSGLQKATTQIH